MRHWILAAALAVLSFAVGAAIREETVVYRDGETELKGFIVFDDAVAGKRPGVIVVHEWWGITAHTREEARKLAGRGYTAMVVDMFGGKTADNPKDAGALAGSVMKNPALMQSRFNAAKRTLAAHPTVDSQRIAAIGFCFGGSVALNMARSGADLAGVVAFHAGLGAAIPAQPGAVKAKVLVLNGADDPYNRPPVVEAFRKEMTEARIDYRYVDYPGAVHAFTNPEATAKGKQFDLPLAYNAEADRQAKAEMAKFLDSVFGR